VLPLLNTFARVPVCGLIAQYSGTRGDAADLLPATMRAILTKSLTLPGIHQLRIRRRTLPGVPEVGLTGPAGRQHHSREDVYDCIEQAPQAFIGMLRGENFGKVLIRLTDEAS
jgi:NADPH-dependent curcumin reductase CurA